MSGGNQGTGGGKQMTKKRPFSLFRLTFRGGLLTSARCCVTVLHFQTWGIAMTKSLPVRAETAISSLGARVTKSRARTLDILMKSRRPLSHLEIETWLTQEQDGALNRVTLYRTLDWLVARQLAHRIEGHDRVWRFGVTLGRGHGHAHFNCVRCGKVYCLPDIAPVFAASLPAGFCLDAMTLSLQGSCPDCVA
jgi:Fur family ferric uptake transcriptional regulator